MNNHPFHMVDKSPWPLTSSTGLIISLSGMLSYMNEHKTTLMMLGILTTSLSCTQWWRDIIRESTFQGMHTSNVKIMLKWGMILFITSEVMFFSSFFWSFFHSSLSPSIEIGMTWPPVGISSFNPTSIPLLNTIILLTSGVSMTWAHNSITLSNYSKTMKSMKITIILGMYFSALQMYEYFESTFCISDSVYGSTFFMSTGFHGIHVIIGTMFILITTKRISSLHFTNKHHLGFEFAAWYWHFVDVIWLFLYMMIYWWGS